MGKITGFLEYERLEEPHEPIETRKKQVGRSIRLPGASPQAG